jgi:hypothetical protein
LQYASLAAKLIEPDNPDLAGTDRITGVPWDLGVQQVFDDAGCASCHDGTPGPANPSISIADTGEGATGEPTIWTFDLGGERIDIEYGLMAGNFTKSHISMLLVDGLMMEEGVEIEMVDPAQPYQSYMVSQSARDSVLVQYVQPTRLYPDADPNDFAFAGTSKWDGSAYENQHPNADTPGFDADQHRALTPEEKYLLILAADMGGQFYSLENAPGQQY